MPPDDIKIEEYKSLRTSIDMHMKLIPEIFAIMIAATSAILGYCFKSQLFVVFLLPLFIVLPCAFLILAQMNEIMLKGAYIKKRYEENVWGWESTLLEFRKKREKDKNKLFSKAAEDAKAFVIIIYFLLLICLSGFLFAFSVKFQEIKLTLSEPFWLFPAFLVSIIVIWVGTFVCSVSLSIGMLKAYTSENEKDILSDLDKVFESSEESMLQGESKCPK